MHLDGNRRASLARLPRAELRNDGLERGAAQVRVRAAAARAAHAPLPLLHGLGERSQTVSVLTRRTRGDGGDHDDRTSSSSS